MIGMVESRRLEADVQFHSLEVGKQRPCPFSKRLAKQLSKKNFRFIRINRKAPGGKFLLS